MPWVLAAADAHAPSLRTLFQIFPGELVSTFSLELVVKWLWIMVVDQNKAFIRSQRFKLVKDKRVTLHRGNGANV